MCLLCAFFFGKWLVLFLVEVCGGKDGRHDGTQDGVADVIMRRCLQSGRWGTFWLSCGSCSYQVICHPLVFLCDSNRILPRDHLEGASLLQLGRCHAVLLHEITKRVSHNLLVPRRVSVHQFINVFSYMGFALQVLISSVIHLLPILALMTVISQYLPQCLSSFSYYFVMDMTFQWETSKCLFST
jgi:hypothetical protein